MKKNKPYHLYIALILLSILLTNTQHLFAQKVTVKSSVDKTHIIIGDQITLQVIADFNPSQYLVQFPSIHDTFNHFELIEHGLYDTTINSAKSIISQNTYITSFDSGQWIIPSFQLNVKPLQGDTPFVIQTNPITIQVQTIAIDTSKPFKPIMGIRAASMPLTQLLLYIALSLFIIAIVIFSIWYFIKKRREKNQKKSQKTPIIHLLPHEKALQALAQIESNKLWQSDQDKIYYTSLTDTLRTYLEEQFEIDCFEKTSSEIIQQVKKQKILNPYRQVLRDLLQLADMVKFAKEKPLEEEHLKSLEEAKDFIITSYKKFKLNDDLMNQSKQSHD